jgi:hypothetical protein
MMDQNSSKENYIPLLKENNSYGEYQLGDINLDGQVKYRKK